MSITKKTIEVINSDILKAIEQLTAVRVYRWERNIWGVRYYHIDDYQEISAVVVKSFNKPIVIANKRAKNTVLYSFKWVKGK